MGRMILMLLTSFLLMSCIRNENVNTDSSELVFKDFYTQQEIAEFDKILLFVDREVIKITGEEEFDRAYRQFFENMKMWNEDRSYFTIDEKEKYAFLENLDPSVFNSVFSFSDTLGRIYYKDTVLNNITGIKTLTLQPYGRFVKYLNRLGESNSMYKDIADVIDLAGDFPAGFYDGFASNHSKFDFNNRVDRLFAALLILRLEDSYEMKLDRYFESRDVILHQK